MKYLVIWDWDGTLSDTFEALKKVHYETCQKYKVPLPSDDFIAQSIRGEKRFFLEGGFPPDLVDEVRRYYHQRSSVLVPQSAKLFKGIRPILEWLKNHGATQIVISNQRHVLLNDEVKREGVTPYFERVLGSYEGRVKKPHPDFLASALKGLSYDEIIVIGDGPKDMEMAQNLNATGLLIRPADPMPQMVFHKHFKTHQELFEYLKKIFK